MRKILALSIGMFLLSVSVVSAQTSTFAVTSIGTIDTSDGVLSSYTYTSENPVIEGTAEELADVLVVIDGVEDSVTADDVGVWSYSPADLLDGGSYEIEITSGTESESFTLTINATSVGGTDEDLTTTKGGEPTLPDSGIEDYTYILVGVGLVGLLGAAIVALK